MNFISILKGRKQQFLPKNLLIIKNLLAFVGLL